MGKNRHHKLYSNLNAQINTLGLAPKKLQQLAKETLTEKEYTVFKNRYGDVKSSLEHIGSLFGRSREWARQKESRIVEKIKKRGACGDFEKNILQGYRQLCYEVVKAMSTAKVVVDESRAKDLAEIAQTRMDGLELSVRAYHCLKYTRTDTLGELAKKTEEEMLMYPNFGRVSLNELIGLLQKYDLNFGMDLEKSIKEAKKVSYIIKRENFERISCLKNNLLNEILNKKLGDFELPSHFNYGYYKKTLGEIVQKTEYEMLQEPWIGSKCLGIIKDVLKKYDLGFGMNVQKVGDKYVLKK